MTDTPREAPQPPTWAMEKAREIGAEMEDACGIYHVGSIGKIARVLAAARREAIEEAIQAIKNIPPCPFDGPTKLEPEDPCPVCGDTGEFTGKAPNCRSPIIVLRALAAAVPADADGA